MPKSRKPRPSKRCGRGAAQVRQQAAGGQAAEDAHWQVDQEDPVPGHGFHQPATQGRTRQGADQAGNGDEAEDADQLAARIDAQDHQAPHRQHQRTAEALDDPGGDQQVEAGRQGAEQRAKGEEGDGGEEDAATAEAIGNPARGGNQQRHGEQVGDHHPLHAQRILAEVGGHARQGGVDDGRVQRLHEEGHGDQPGKPAGRGGIQGRGGHGRSLSRQPTTRSLTVWRRQGAPLLQRERESSSASIRWSFSAQSMLTHCWKPARNCASSL